MEKKEERETVSKHQVNKFNREIAMNLKNLRMERNLTQEYMAECFGKGYTSSYATIEQGKKKLTFEDAVKISEIFEVPLSRILDPVSSDLVGKSEEGTTPYGQPRKSSMQISVTLTGDSIDLQKQIRLLEKVNEILANDSV